MANENATELCLRTSSSVELHSIEPAQPLWKRAPTRSPEGERLSDFMMIIPKLRHQHARHIEETIQKIQHALDAYKKVVVFADLNLKLNVLWVSVKPRPGICLELPAVIQSLIPEARLVGERLHP